MSELQWDLVEFYDYSEEKIMNMSPFEVFEEWLKCQGIIGYSSEIIDALYKAECIDCSTRFDIVHNC